MFQFRNGERRYRRQAFAAVERLFHGIPGTTSAALIEAFPDIGPLVGRLRPSGRTPEAVALMVAVPMLSELVLNGLGAEDRAEIVAILRDAPAAPPVPQSSAALLAGGIRGMIAEAVRWSDRGWIRQADVDLVVSELIGAVRGKDPETRSIERLLNLAAGG